MRLKLALAAPRQHRGERAVIHRRQTKMAARQATPGRQPGCRGYRLVPKPWGQMPLLGVAGGT